MKVIFLFIFLIAVVGCFGGREPFQPPPQEYQVWEKSGSGKIEVQKALLECGYPDPFNSGRYAHTWSELLNWDRCLMGDGFTFKADQDWWFYHCSKIKSRGDACDVNYVPSKRSIQKRLNSPYCIKYKDAPACKI